jgi:hypothetical protein
MKNQIKSCNTAHHGEEDTSPFESAPDYKLCVTQHRLFGNIKFLSKNLQ